MNIKIIIAAVPTTASAMMTTITPPAMAPELLSLLVSVLPLGLRGG